MKLREMTLVSEFQARKRQGATDKEICRKHRERIQNMLISTARHSNAVCIMANPEVGVSSFQQQLRNMKWTQAIALSKTSHPALSWRQSTGLHERSATRRHRGRRFWCSMSCRPSFQATMSGLGRQCASCSGIQSGSFVLCRRTICRCRKCFQDVLSSKQGISASTRGTRSSGMDICHTRGRLTYHMAFRDSSIV